MIRPAAAARRAAIAALFVCVADAASAAPAGPAPGGFTTRLEDHTEALPDERVRWSTEWILCWEPQPEAVAYEVQISTSEGYSRKTTRVESTCHRVEVAKDEGPPPTWPTGVRCSSR